MPEPQLHFIISAPRSGSTWLSRALNCHPEIFVTEHRLFGSFFEVWNNNDGSQSPRITLDAYVKGLSGHYFCDQLGLTKVQFRNQMMRLLMRTLLKFAESRSEKKIVIDKITPYPGTSQQVIASLMEFFPESKIIQLIRDGRDVTTSGTFDWILKDAHGTERYQYFVGKKPGLELNRFFDHEVILKWAQNWKETLEIFDEGDPDLRISYESMKKNQAAELCRIFELCGVDDSQEIAKRAADEVSFEKTTGRRSGRMESTAKARNGMVGDWTNYFTRVDGELFHCIAGEHLMKNGYESDEKWFEKLPDELALGPHDR